MTEFQQVVIFITAGSQEEAQKIASAHNDELLHVGFRELLTNLWYEAKL